MQKNQIPLLIFSGPSGVGKGTLLSRFMKSYGEKLEMSVSWTTRKMRSGEIDGVSYYFKSKEEFDEEDKKGGFIEVSSNYDNKYGTNKQVLDEIMQRGKICVLEVDVEAAAKIHKQYPNSNFIFFNVKNPETLYERMKKRNTETEEQIQRRLMKGEMEMREFRGLGIYKEIFNEDVENCYQEMVEYIKTYYPILKED